MYSTSSAATARPLNQENSVSTGSSPSSANGATSRTATAVWIQAATAGARCLLVRATTAGMEPRSASE